MDKIFDARDYATREKARSVKQRLNRLAIKKGLLFRDKFSTFSVLAEVNAGRWIALCPDCNGAEAVSIEDPMFFCLSCGNNKLGGELQQVIFPEDYKAIEELLLQRKIKLGAGRDQLSQMVNGVPESLPRAWVPGETLKDLIDQNEQAGI